MAFRLFDVFSYIRNESILQSSALQFHANYNKHRIVLKRRLQRQPVCLSADLLEVPVAKIIESENTTRPLSGLFCIPSIILPICMAAKCSPQYSSGDNMLQMFTYEAEICPCHHLVLLNLEPGDPILASPDLYQHVLMVGETRSSVTGSRDAEYKKAATGQRYLVRSNCWSTAPSIQPLFDLREQSRKAIVSGRYLSGNAYFKGTNKSTAQYWAVSLPPPRSLYVPKIGQSPARYNISAASIREHPFQRQNVITPLRNRFEFEFV